ncbi:HNH endonuclease [Craterilacuibacter sp.]|uniref:HNH endonuclease n=1 Tax=Craterilacuibacter sp. TaxID=2870909 RepID=UPI003F386DB6
MPLLGEADDLEAFLFAPSRKALGIMAAGLRKLDGSRCFYCRASLSEADVDHYIPFSRYPRDLAHNFVLAHPACNRSKSDTLAALPHLERWLERIEQCSDALAEIGAEAGFLTDEHVTLQVGAWAYTNGIAAGGQAWLAPKDYQAISPSYLRLFSAQSPVHPPTQAPTFLAAEA